MTVQELIDRLQEMPDKTLDIILYDWGYMSSPTVIQVIENKHGKNIILIDVEPQE